MNVVTSTPIRLRLAISIIPQKPLPSPVPKPPPTPTPYVKPCDRNGVKKNQEELDDLAGNLGGKITYTKPGKPDSQALITGLKGNPTFGDVDILLYRNGWDPIFGNLTLEHWGGDDYKHKGKFGNWYHVTVFRNESEGGFSYFNKPPTKLTIHCDNGNPQNPFHER